MGTMLGEMDMRDGGQAMKLKARLPEVTEVSPTLSDMGLSKRQSSNFQKMAGIPEERFEEVAPRA